MKQIIYIIMCVVALSACTKEIDFEFHDEDPVVVIEAKVTNEGRTVIISRSRPMNDSVRAHCLPGANIVITGDGNTTVLTYNAASDSYFSPVPGEAGHTYQLSVDFEGQHYEASATMPDAAPITSAAFCWVTVLNERMLCYELWGIDPEPDTRNYFWLKMHRISHHPHLEGTRQTKPFSTKLMDDRGFPPGKLFADWTIISEKAMDDDEEDNWKRIPYDGDSIYVTQMTVDRQVYNYLYELSTGQYNGANPHSNISGGCLGYFAAGSVTHSDTIVFKRADVKEWDLDEIFNELTGSTSIVDSNINSIK